MSHLDILIPFGLPPAELSADLLKELSAPALSTLTARAKSDPAATYHETFSEFSRALPHERWLSRQFGLEAELKKRGSPPVATALMQSLGLRVEAGNWFILQPVHIHFARDHLVLTDPRQLQLADQEACILFDIAKSLLEETGKHLLYGNANTWFVRADDWAELQTSSPDATSGHNIDIWMPKGPGERDWRKVQNEIQMHWFNHPINEAREMRGLKPVNSLWLWGGSDGDAACAPGRYDSVFNLSDWLQAFNCFATAHAKAETATDLLANGCGHSLLVLDALLESALSNDWSRWLDGMRSFEANWFAPLLQALKAGTLDQVSLVLTNDARISQFTASRSSLRKFWVKPSLATLCP